MLSRTANDGSTATSTTGVATLLKDLPKGSTASVGQSLDKSEINEAVTKVLKGYDWTLVPIASK